MNNTAQLLSKLATLIEGKQALSDHYRVEFTADLATHSPAHLVNYVHGMAGNDAEIVLYRRCLEGAKGAAEFGASDEQVIAWTKEAINEALLSGADDTWSGRGNDLRRCEFDGTRRAARELLEYIKFNLKATAAA